MLDMNTNKIIESLQIIVPYCLGGIVIALLIVSGLTKIYPDFKFVQRTVVLTILTGGAYGFVLARLRLITKNISICAATDPLTHLNNRLRFNEILDREILRSNRHNTELSVILVDIDSFNAIQKKYARKTADDVLMRVATIVKAVSRDVDICARWGADDFILLLPDTSLEGAVKTAERIRTTVEEEFIPVVGQVTVSLGIAQYKPEKDLKETFIDRADNALYRVKKSGRNAIEVESYKETA